MLASHEYNRRFVDDHGKWAYRRHQHRLLLLLSMITCDAAWTAFQIVTPIMSLAMIAPANFIFLTIYGQLHCKQCFQCVDDVGFIEVEVRGSLTAQSALSMATSEVRKGG